MKRVIIYGGAFDPIGNHHMNIAELAKAHTDEVWFMPCYGHLFGKKPTLPRHRFNMVRLACEEQEGFVASDFEIQKTHTGSTLETLEDLQKAYPNVTFSILIGTDNAKVIEKWHRYQEMIESYPFVVVGEDYESNKLQWFKQGHHVYIEKEESGRSTQIREAAQKENWKYVFESVDPKVYQYIQNEGLYT